MTDGNWRVFDDAILSDLRIDDCNDTIDGVCETDLNIDECIDICENSKDCKFGYYLYRNGEQICVPIQNRNIDPYYRLREKNIYPALKNFNTKLFISTEYNFPPKGANSVFYEDFFWLQNISNGETLTFYSKSNDGIEFGKKGENGVGLQFLPFREISPVQNYRTVEYGDQVIINIPGTNLSISGKENNLSWATANLTDISYNDTFQIFSKLGNKKMFYGDEIYIAYNGKYIALRNGKLELVPKTKLSKENIFIIIPRVNAYYCDGEECKSISLSNTKTNKDVATYDGSLVTRDPTCWKICTRKKETRSDLISLIIVLITIIIVLGLFLV